MPAPEPFGFVKAEDIHAQDARRFANIDQARNLIGRIKIWLVVIGTRSRILYYNEAKSGYVTLKNELINQPVEVFDH